MKSWRLTSLMKPTSHLVDSALLELLDLNILLILETMYVVSNLLILMDFRDALDSSRSLICISHLTVTCLWSTVFTVPSPNAFQLRRSQACEASGSTSISFVVLKLWAWHSKINFKVISDPTKNLSSKFLDVGPCILISSVKERPFSHSLYLKKSCLQCYFTLECSLRAKTRVFNKSSIIPCIEVIIFAKIIITFSIVSTVGFDSPSGTNT